MILPCNTNKDRKLFETIPEILHRKDPNFVPLFPNSIVEILSPKGAFQQIHGKITPFIAYSNGQPIGRIAAIVNQSHNTYRKEKVGHFGFFDCENRPETAAALFDAVESLFKKEGLDTVRGPYNPSIHDDCGLLVEGFGTPATISMPQNPPYYESLITGLGYQKKHDLYSFLIPLAKEAPSRFKRILERIERSTHLTMRNMDMNRLDEELEIFCRLYNATLNQNFGYYPISLNELQHAAKGLKVFADPNLIQFVEMDGEPVGVTFILPDINEILHRSRKRTGWIRFIEILLRIKFQHIHRMRMAVLGVAPEHRDKGIGAWMYCKMFERGYTLGYKESEVSWIDEENKDILKAIHLMGCRLDKTFRLFERSLLSHEKSV